MQQKFGGGAVPIRINDKTFRALLPGILALATVLVLVVGLLIGLEQPFAPTEPTLPETTEPTVLAPNPYGPGDFTYDDRGFLTCTAGTATLGIDVSEHQQDIDWEQVKAAGVEFVMIRVGWRGQTKGALEEDTMARRYYAGAKAAGLKVGAYFFSQAISEAEAVEEAEFVMNIIRKWDVEMPVVFDWEIVDSADRTCVVDADLLTRCTKAFCDAVTRGGYRPMIYFNPYQAENLLHLEELAAYPFWLAMYDDAMDYPYAVAMWQYSCTGQVPGIETDVDMNLWFS